MFRASVIIPAYQRQDLLDRAVKSVLAQNGSECVEIIVVDDNSPEPLLLFSNRSQDKIIRNSTNQGAAVSRNIGIVKSQSEWIFLLDSDDYFIDVDFDCLDRRRQDVLYSCNIVSGNGNIKMPRYIAVDNYFDCILFSCQGALQTSSLSFHRSLNVFFDESLPKHQDWDFILFEFLMKDRQVVIDGGCCVYFDKNDKSSLSRKTNPDKSRIWIDKLETNGRFCIDKVWIANLKIRFLGMSDKDFSVLQLLKLGVAECFARRLRFIDFLKVVYRRAFDA